MFTHEELMEQWATDTKIDPTELLDAMYNHPKLHSKYLNILQDYKINQRKQTLKYQNKRLILTRYYNGELTKEELIELKLQQYQFRKPLKAEMETLLDADPALQKIQEQVLYMDTLIQSCEHIMKDIGNRYFLFKHIIEQTKFLSGAS